MTWAQPFVRDKDPLPRPGQAGRRAVSAFYVARSGSLIGDSAAAACLALLILQRFGSVQALGTFFVARAAPRLLGPVLGSLSDRRDLRRLLRACDATSAVLYTVIALLVPGLPVLLVLVVAAEIVAVISLPGTRTAVTRLVPEYRLTTATANVTAIAGLSTAAGAALGGLISALVGARYGLALNALSFLVSALLMSTLPAMPPQATPTQTPDPRWASRFVAGFPVLLSRRVRVLPLVLIIIAFGAALDRTALVVLSERVLTDGSSLAYGFAIGAVSIGVFLSATLVRRRPEIVGYPALVLALALQGGSHALAGASPSAALLASITLIIGFGNGLEVIVAMRLLQKAVGTSSLGAANGALLTSTTLLDATGSALGAVLLTEMSARAVFYIAGSLMLAAAVPTYLSVRKPARPEGNSVAGVPDSP